MIKLKRLTGVLLLLSSCKSIHRNMNDNDYNKMKKEYEERTEIQNQMIASNLDHMKRITEGKSASNGSGNQTSCYRKEYISTAPPESVLREREREMEEKIKNEKRARAMLEAYSTGDVVSREGDLTGCNVL
ncbi:hypothetical protein ACRRVD_03865 [Candidatus Cardinium hertigii]|uniref:hypothetical protein n=1 Tax=Candidatus Cardinium hertigii TaxID=247481 RepID=UPI003D7E0AB8